MQTCIWCSFDDTRVTFNKKAHTIPHSLGGENICDNVCDKCNHHFGSPKPQSPAVEVVLKEILNISKYLLLDATNDLPQKGRFKSEYFNFNLKNKSILLKPKYKLHSGYQEKLGRLFRRGIYKVFLEERERQRGDAQDDRYNFIREFSRYDLGDYPVYILKPKFQAVFFSATDVKNPTIRFTEHSDLLDSSFRVFEYQLMGHTFCIPTSRNFSDFNLGSYKKYLRNTDHAFGIELIEIKYAENIDYTFNILKD